MIDRQIFPPISPFAPRGELCRAIPEVLIDDGAILRVELEPVHDDVETLLLTSADGKAWERSPLPMPKGRAVFHLSCNLDACVVPIDPLDEDRTEREVLVSSNGRDWSAVMLDLPMLDEGLTMRFIQPVGSEFVAIAGNSGFALLSADGRDWIPVQVMPPDRVEWLGGLAVAGDVVVGYAPSQAADTTDAIWQGSLSEMRKG